MVKFALYCKLSYLLVNVLAVALCQEYTHKRIHIFFPLCHNTQHDNAYV